MRSARVLSVFSLLVLVTLLVTVPATVGNADTPSRSPRLSQAQPGNYCVGCHTPGDDRLETVMDWTGSIDRELVSGCAAASRVREEVYYTERLLLAIDRARAELPGWVDASKTDARVAAARQTYSRLLDTPITSLDALTSEAQVLRFRLGKSYTWLNQVRDALKRGRVLLFAGLVTLVLLVSLGWGLRNTAQFTSSWIGQIHPRFKTVLFLIMVFVLFALPIFRLPPQEVESSSEEEQARQAALDTSNRAADATERALARSWMLARVGAAWFEDDPQKAEESLAAALVAADETQMDAAALWGEAQAAQEATVGSQIAQEKAVLAADRLDAINSRVWALRLIAAEWASADPARAEEILEQALDVATGQAAGTAPTGLYRELDVRAIAVTWANIDPVRGLAVAKRVYDPALRAWALWEIAGITGDESLYEQAAQAARQVSDPVDRARSLRELAVRSGNRALFEEALAALDGVEPASLAYALSDLAAASGEAAIAVQIDSAYPDARAAALYRVGQFDEAWATAAEIDDPFDQARAQAAIAAAWSNSDAAQQITDPTTRDLALREIAVAEQDAALAASIESPYYRVQALTALGQYQAAFDGAEGLSDTYPLRALAVAWAETDPQSALGVVDAMDREADKAEALRAIAVVVGDEATFKRALDLALAARVRGDALAPAEASLALAMAFSPLDESKAEDAFVQAFDVTQRISTKYK
jgi:hypothetical protein